MAFKRILVYRIENEEGHGPYTGRGSVPTWDNRLYLIHNNASRPSPDEEIPAWKEMNYKLHYDYYFGFKNITQLKAWFTKRGREELRMAGYQVCVYSIANREGNVHHGKAQCCFMKKRAKKVDTRKVPE